MGRPEAAGSVEAGGSVLTAEVGAGERRALVDVLVAQRTLPAGRALTQVAVVLVHARGAVAARVAEAFAHRQQLQTYIPRYHRQLIIIIIIVKFHGGSFLVASS